MALCVSSIHLGPTDSRRERAQIHAIERMSTLQVDRLKFVHRQALEFLEIDEGWKDPRYAS